MIDEIRGHAWGIAWQIETFALWVSTMISAMFVRIISFIIALLLLSSPATSSDIFLKKEGGIYTLPVKINRVITLDFILDSGASEVCIPADVAMTLLRAHTIEETDFLPGKSYTLADGSVVRSQRFLIRELEMDGIKMSNVPAMISPVQGDLLLGQSFLQRLDSWTIDNQRHALVVGKSLRHEGEQKEQTISFNRQMDSSISKKEVSDLIQDIIQCSAHGDIDVVLKHYADKVNYFAKGLVDKDFIRKDKENYYKRWSKVIYNLDGDIEYETSYEPNTIIANFTMDYYVSNNKKSIQGKATNVLKMNKINGSLQIVDVKEQVISREIK